MGIRVLARSAESSLAILEARLASLGANLDSSAPRWRQQCIYMRPRNDDSGLQGLFVLQASEDLDGAQHIVSQGRIPSLADASAFPATTAPNHVRVMRAGPEIASVLEAMQTHSQRLKVAIEGGSHACGDFCVRLGEVRLPVHSSPGYACACVSTLMCVCGSVAVLGTFGE